MPRRRWSHRLLAVLVLLVGPWAAALAEETGAPLPDPSCQDGGVISGKLLTDICWDCIFPIRMGGVASFGSERAAGAVIPDGASEQTFCACDDGAGLPHPGYTVAMWMPAMLFELVRSPGCAMTLGGIKLPITDPRDWVCQHPQGSRYAIPWTLWYASGGKDGQDDHQDAEDGDPVLAESLPEGAHGRRVRPEGIKLSTESFDCSPYARKRQIIPR